MVVLATLEGKTGKVTRMACVHTLSGGTARGPTATSQKI